jgi:hypothetical protein
MGFPVKKLTFTSKYYSYTLKRNPTPSGSALPPSLPACLPGYLGLAAVPSGRAEGPNYCKCQMLKNYWEFDDDVGVKMCV